MQKLYFLIAAIILPSFLLNNLKAQCANGRYYDQIFSENTSTVIYGNAVLYNGVDTNLRVDIYQPAGDTIAQRPLMIFAFGGSFVSGLRQSPDLVYLCTAFSKRGYVCASIDYRLGYYGSGTDTNLFEAMIRGIQDMKAAVRFFYKDASTANQYRIDTNQIFIGGVSAGAFIALNYGFWNYTSFSKNPPGFALPVLDSLGGIEGNSGNPGYSDRIKGVIDLCGGIVDTIWITSPSAPLLVGVHGTADNTVACTYDSLYALTNTKSMLFGGCDIKNRLSHIANTDSFYLFQGADHCPFIIPYPPTYNPVPWMDTTEWIIRDYLVQHVTCPEGTTGIAEPAEGTLVTVYPNPAGDFINVTSRYAHDIAVTLLNNDGRQLQQYNVVANSTLVIYKNKLAPGIYLLNMVDKSTGQFIKTESVEFY